METVLSILEIIGIISFSAAGAMVAIDRETDVFGVVFLSVITCYGGGLLRDVMVGASIGRERPWLFLGSDDATLYMTLTVVTALAVFLIALLFKKRYAREERAVLAINNVLDALGIGIFAAIGTGACLELGAFVAITMGMVTCVGGGLMRDVILRDVPFILRKYVYAVATIIGSALYYLVAAVWMPAPLTTKTSVLLNTPISFPHILYQVCGLAIQHITNLLQCIHGQVLHRTHTDGGHRRRTDTRLFCQFLLGHTPQGKHHFDFELYHRLSPLSYWLLYHAFRSKAIRKTKKYFDFRKRNYELRIDKLRIS